MAPKKAFNAFDTLLKDFLNCDKPFGNLIVILSGDFKKTLPIVKHGNRTQIIENIVKSSHLWKYFQKISLINNLCLTNAGDSCKNWLLSIGDGIFANKSNKRVELLKIPDYMLCETDLLLSIYNFFDNKSMDNQVILATTNIDALDIDNEILNKLSGEKNTYCSLDTAHDQNSIIIISLTPTWLPQNKITLKISAIVYLLRNLNINA